MAPERRSPRSRARDPARTDDPGRQQEHGAGTSADGRSGLGRDRDRGKRQLRPRSTETMTCSRSQPGSPRTVPKRREAQHRQRSPRHRQDARAHRRGHHRHDHEVDPGRDQGESPEGHEDVRNVAAWAASEMPRLSASQPGIRPPRSPPASGRGACPMPAGPRSRSRRGGTRVADQRGSPSSIRTRRATGPRLPDRPA